VDELQLVCVSEVAKYGAEERAARLAHVALDVLERVVEVHLELLGGALTELAQELCRRLGRRTCGVGVDLP
jgi:histone H3/H4